MQRVNKWCMGFVRAAAECLRMMGGIPSPPMVLEQSSDERALKVSCREMVTEHRELLGKDLEDNVSECTEISWHYRKMQNWALALSISYVTLKMVSCR